MAQQDEQPAWERKREDDILHLMLWVENMGQAGKNITSLTREEVADEVGWPISKLDRIIRFIKEHPDYSFGVTFGWFDTEHGLIGSTANSKIQGTEVVEEYRSNRNQVLSGILRIARAVGAQAAHYQNIKNKTTSEARTAAKYKREARNLLVGQQNVLNSNRPDEARVITKLEEIIQAL